MDNTNDTTSKSNLEKNPSGYFMDVRIPPECLDDSENCKCAGEHKKEKKNYNPV